MPPSDPTAWNASLRIATLSFLHVTEEAAKENKKSSLNQTSHRKAQSSAHTNMITAFVLSDDATATMRQILGLHSCTCRGRPPGNNTFEEDSRTAGRHLILHERLEPGALCRLLASGQVRTT